MITTQAALAWAPVDSYVSGTHVSASTSLHERWRGCPICGAHRERVIQEQPLFQFYTDSDKPKRMTLREVQCLNCYALYKNPTFSAQGMAELFAEAGQSYGHGTQAQAQVDWLRDNGILAERSSVLDVGCGAGQFLSLMPSSWKRMGIEPDAHLAATCHDSGLQCFAEKVPEQPFDLITLWHVLEHVPNPIGTLTKLRALAHDNTRLVVEVPVLELGATPDVTGFFSPQHVTHFSYHTLLAALWRAGWTTELTVNAFGYNGRRVVARPAVIDGMLTADFEGASGLSWYLARQYQHMAAVQHKAEQSGRAPKRVMWGAGMHVETLYQQTTMFAQVNRGYLLIDSDPLKQGKSWRGIPIKAPADVLPFVDWAETDLLISSYGDQPVMVEAAKALHVPESRIVTLYDASQVKSY